MPKQPLRLGAVLALAWGACALVLIGAALPLARLPHAALARMLWVWTWIVLPLVSATVPALCARLGVTPLAAWLAPPACWLLSLLCWHLPFMPGALLLSCVLAVISAATGDELRKRKR